MEVDILVMGDGNVMGTRGEGVCPTMRTVELRKER